jgi:hypothetical protein
MVKTSHLLILSIVVLLLVAFTGTTVAAWAGTYHLEQEWAKIWILQDGTIDLFYNLSVKLDSGDNINHIDIGQPNGDFRIGPAKDQYNRTLSTSDASSGSDYKVQVNLAAPLAEGQTIWFTLVTNVGHMIYEDNQTNVGMQFIPTWLQDGRVVDMRVSVVLPVGVNASIVGTSVLWNYTQSEPDGRLSIFWERQNLEPTKQYYDAHANFGVSFPKQYVQKYEPKQSGLQAFLQQYGPAIFILALVAVIGGGLVLIVRKRPYVMPTASIETLGIRHGLTAVEASYLLDLEPTKIVTEILYSLLHKRAVWVESATPSLKVKIMKPFENKTGPQENPLRYYEIDFLSSVKEDGALDEEELAQTVMYLRDDVEEKMRGYCRRDTIDYYRNIVEKAWQQVEQAGTPELASKAYDEQLLWLLLDPEYQNLTKAAFRNRSFEPSPLWFWYWYGYQHYYANPTYKPNIETPTRAGKPPAIPGADFANNMAKAVETTSNNIVVNMEKFANAILPISAGEKASHEPAHAEASCVCACAACACACACVSCACACAGGGVG